MTAEPRRVLSADETLNEALITAAHINDLGLEAYTQNGGVLVAEVAARAALTEAVTNRVRLLHDLLRDATGPEPMFLSAELSERYSTELIRLLTPITGSTHAEA